MKGKNMDDYGNEYDAWLDSQMERAMEDAAEMEWEDGAVQYLDDVPEMDRFEDDAENFELDQLAHDAYLEAQAELMNESYDVDEDF